MYEIHIKPVLNGYVCNVGCQTVVFNDLPAMLGELNAYLTDPRKTEIEYRETALNHKWTLDNGPAAVPQSFGISTQSQPPVLDGPWLGVSGNQPPTRS
jgi:hypothetical protein